MPGETAEREERLSLKKCTVCTGDALNVRALLVLTRLEARSGKRWRAEGKVAAGLARQVCDALGRPVARCSGAGRPHADV